MVYHMCSSTPWLDLLFITAQCYYLLVTHSYLYAGIDVRLSRTKDGASWAVLVATPIMRRAQQLHAAREIIFVDSTSSCDTTHATVTVLLAATSAGAVPIAVVLHNSQTAQAYAAAFTLLKETYPLCFGGLSVSVVLSLTMSCHFLFERLVKFLSQQVNTRVLLNLMERF